MPEAEVEEVKIEQPEISYGEAESFEFQAETMKLLDIVAKSIYTDKEVFIREMLSNASDALEKHRYAQISGKADPGDDLRIEVSANEQERTITFYDTGSGMTRDEIIQNLGTIARSGSEEFRDAVDNSDTAESIIGQFGVGFYSSFIVADKVEVYSRANDA